jgi:hypothetical protein
VQNTSQCSFNVALVLPNGSVPALDPRILLALATILAGMGLIFADRRR